MSDNETAEEEVVRNNCACCGDVMMEVGSPYQEEAENALDGNLQLVRVHKSCTYLCAECGHRYGLLGYHRSNANYTGMRFWDINNVNTCNACYLQWRSQGEQDGYRIEMCRYCDTYIQPGRNGAEQSSVYSDEYACHRCWNQERECDDCNNWYHPDYDHDCYSDNNSRRSYGIHSYGYKPSPIFFGGKAPYYFGIELEVESQGNDMNEALDYLEVALSDRAYLKQDGSLTNGFEIVTHPHSLQELQEQFPWEILKTLKVSGWRSWNTRTCGLHVHVSRTAFTAPTYQQRDTHQIKFLKLIYDNKDYVQRLAGRKSSWAKFDDKGHVIRKVKDGYQSEGRYSAVNVQPDKTLEVRVFRGSLRKERVLAAAEFVGAAVEYTRDLKIIPKNNPFSWDNFMGYALSNNKTYPNLSIILNEMLLKSQSTISRQEETV